MRLLLNLSLGEDKVLNSLLLVVGVELEGVGPLLEGELLLSFLLHQVHGVLVDLDLWDRLDQLELDDHLLSKWVASWTSVEHGHLVDLVLVGRLGSIFDLDLDFLVDGGVSLYILFDAVSKAFDQSGDLISLLEVSFKDTAGLPRPQRFVEDLEGGLDGLAWDDGEHLGWTGDDGGSLESPSSVAMGWAAMSSLVVSTFMTSPM